MKAKWMIIAFIAISLNGMTLAQKLNDAAASDIELKIESEDGNNGLAVAFNQDMNIYYTVFAGNESYPFEAHSLDGSSLRSSSIGVDARGMWYNSTCNCIQGTMYDNMGSYEMALDGNGFPKPVITSSVTYNLGGQGVTTGYKKYLYSLDQSGMVLKFKIGSSKSKKINIAQNYSDFSNLNMNAIIHTGIKGHELGFVNFSDNTLVLFNEKSGKLTKTIRIQMQGMVMPEYFNVSYANERLFIFNSETRSWRGFKITE